MKLLKLIAITFLCAAPLLRADVIFEEDFEVDDAKSLTTWKIRSDHLTEADGAWQEVQADTDNNFGMGESNRVLVLNDRSEDDLIFVSPKFKGAEDVTTVGFDFFEPLGHEGGPAVIRIGAHDDVDGARRMAVNMAMSNGSLSELRRGAYAGGAYQTGSKHRMHIVVNNSAETLEYGDKVSLPSRCFDVYVDGVVVESGVPFRADSELGVSEPLSDVSFLTYIKNTKDQTFMIDNFVIQTGARAP